MFEFTTPVARLIEELKKIPSIGPKSAQRICFYLLKRDRETAMRLAHAIIEARENTRLCERCFNITTQRVCEICVDERRNGNQICVVEEPFNIVSIEQTQLFNGVYHVLHGNLSPIRGVGPDELKIDGLIRRIQDATHHEEMEVILATSPTTEGNATAHYLFEILRPHGVKVTRIALGLPVGADLDYVDSVTIARAMESRREILQEKQK